MKKQKFNNEQITLLTSALMKSLFPKPLLGELLVGDGFNDGSYWFYFSDAYHSKLYAAIRLKYDEGEFKKSNAEYEWNNLMLAVKSAQDTDDNTSLFESHLLSIDPKQPKVEIDQLALKNILAIPRQRKDVHISRIIENLVDDIYKVYIGHKCMYNFNGYLTIERSIIENSMFPTELQLRPLFHIIEYYEVEIDSFKVKSNTNSTKIFVEFYLQ